MDPLVYAELPIGISGYYRDEHETAIDGSGWSAWSKEKDKPRRFDHDWEGLECMVGLRPHRFLDYARFEALATSLGLDTALRVKLAEEFKAGRIGRPSRIGAIQRIDSSWSTSLADVTHDP